MTGSIAVVNLRRTLGLGLPVGGGPERRSRLGPCEWAGWSLTRLVIHT